eukprot:c5278_g1_i1.p1 GENE.c5278_g1_i1~~c5278_g1_i1.p1  ORF type:complete len:367 (+),score=91.80 c5278_g1_i1:36-1103(+)
MGQACSGTSTNEQKAQRLRQKVQKNLGKITLGTLPPSQRGVISVKASDPLVSAFETLFSNHILSAPVQNEQDNSYLGFVDTRDLVTSVVSLHKANPVNSTVLVHPTIALGDFVAKLTVLDENQPENPDAPVAPPTRRSTRLTPGQEALREATHQLDMWTPAYVAKLHPLTTATSTTNLLELCRILASNTERVIELDKDGKAIRIVSQSWVISVVNERVSEVGQEQVPISALGIKPKDIYFCLKTQPTIEGFKMMLEHDISSVPIVDDNHVLLGQLGAADLTHFLETRDLSQLDKPLEIFKQLSSTPAEIGISADATVGEIFQRFIALKKHKLFLVDSNGVVVGSCSLKDLLKSLV